ncbi:Uncharacterised protein [Bordetella pertussis]|nr:Uncharacterised protein [Bordetella pertussis]
MFFLAAIGAQPVSALLRRHASRRRPRSIARGGCLHGGGRAHRLGPWRDGQSVGGVLRPNPKEKPRRRSVLQGFPGYFGSPDLVTDPLSRVGPSRLAGPLQYCARKLSITLRGAPHQPWL